MRRFISAILVALATLSGFGQEPSPSEGSFSLHLQTSSFSAPLFESQYSTTANLFLSQRLRTGERLTLFGSQSHPTSLTYLTLQISELIFFGGKGELAAGDIGTDELRPPRLAVSGLSSGAIRLQGVGGRWSGGDRQAQLTLGRERFRVQLPNQEAGSRSLILDGDWMQQFGRTHLGAGLMLIEEPLYIEDDSNDDAMASLFEGTYIRELRPYVHLFSSATTDQGGNLAGRLGVGGRFQNGDLGAHLFSFSDSLPLVYPVVRPGESGVQVEGAYRITNVSRIAGGVTWLDESPLTRGSSFRSSASYHRSFGEDRPSLAVRWDYNDLIYDFVGEDDVARFGNRYSIEARKYSRLSSYSAVLEHNDDSRGDRTQLLGSYGRVLNDLGRADAFAVVQRDEMGDYGLIAEATIERQWRGNYSYSVGLGATYLTGIEDRADGVFIIGIARRNIRNGWYGRIDLTLPFGIGLPRANRVSDRIRAGIGTSYNWGDLSELRRLVAPLIDRNAYGSIEGRLTDVEGEPVEGAAIIIDGRQRARTGADGTFSVARVRVGPATVTVDPFSVDPSLFVGDQASSTVMVEPRDTSTVELVLQRAVAFFGSIVRCTSDGEIVPLANAEFALISDQQAYTVETTNTGSFALDSVTPGVYQIVINPTEELPAELIPELTIDLTSDVLGYVIRIGCD